MTIRADSGFFCSFSHLTQLTVVDQKSDNTYNSEANVSPDDPFFSGSKILCRLCGPILLLVVITIASCALLSAVERLESLRFRSAANHWSTGLLRELCGNGKKEQSKSLKTRHAEWDCSSARYWPKDSCDRG
jgi:hypothetical protein